MDAEGELARQNWLEAKSVVRKREDSFFDQLKDGIRYSAVANAGAVAAILGFLGSTEKTLVSSRPTIPAFVLFTLGLVCSGATIGIAAFIHRNNFAEALHSYIKAAREADLSFFNDTARGQDRLLLRLYIVWGLSFLFFVAGVIAGIIGFSVLQFK